MPQIPFPIPLFFDYNGEALEAGYIYIGEAGQSARDNPIQVYWDVDLSETAAQPIRTEGGYPTYQGAPSGLYIAETECSVTVLDRNQRIVLLNEDTFSMGNGGGSGSSVFNSRVDAEAAYVSSSVDFVITGGYYASGDGGGAQFKRATGPFTDGASFQSADGAWWLYSPHDIVSISAFGAIGDGATNNTSAIQNALDFASDNNLDVVVIPGTGTFICKGVNVPSDLYIKGLGGTIKAPAGSSGGVGDNAVFELSNVSGVTFDGVNFGFVNSSDIVTFIGADTCHDLDVINCSLKGSRTYLLGLIHCYNFNITNNIIKLGYGGSGSSVGIQLIGDCQYFNISGNIITGAKVTQPNAGVGTTPTGDLWGGVAINVSRGDTWANRYQGWSSVQGTFTKPNGGGAFGPIANALIIDEDNWEGAVATTVDANGIGAYQPLLQGVVTFTAGNISFTGLPSGGSSLTSTYTCFYYGNCPRYGTIDNNTMSGMIYAGISIITGRDITASGNIFQHIGDIAWDPEGVQRCHVSNSTFMDCHSGALISGFQSSVSNCIFRNLPNGTTNLYGVRLSGPLYQGYTDVPVYGLSGANRVVNNTFVGNPRVCMSLVAKTSCLVVSGNSQNMPPNIRYSGGNYIAVQNVSYLTVSNNNTQCGIQIAASNYAVISDNTITYPVEQAIDLDSTTKFVVKGNTISRTSTSFGGGPAIRYGNSTTGYIDANYFINLSGATQIADLGGNTSVTVGTNTNM